LRRGMDDGFNRAAMLLEQLHYRGGVANIHVVMLVTPNVRDQIVARFFRGSFGAEKFCAHVVVYPDDARAFTREALYTLRANQSGRTCDDDRAHCPTRSDGLAVVF